MLANSNMFKKYLALTDVERKSIRNLLNTAEADLLLKKELELRQINNRLTTEDKGKAQNDIDLLENLKPAFSRKFFNELKLLKASNSNISKSACITIDQTLEKLSNKDFATKPKLNIDTLKTFLKKWGHNPNVKFD